MAQGRRDGSSNVSVQATLPRLAVRRGFVHEHPEAQVNAGDATGRLEAAS